MDSRFRMRVVSTIAVMTVLLVAVAARADVRTTGTPSPSRLLLGAPAHAAHPMVASMLVTLPPQEKPKTHWPWWLRILAVIGVFVFIRIVAGSVRNNPSGKPGPG